MKVDPEYVSSRNPIDAIRTTVRQRRAVLLVLPPEKALLPIPSQFGAIKDKLVIREQIRVSVKSHISVVYVLDSLVNGALTRFKVKLGPTVLLKLP